MRAVSVVPDFAACGPTREVAHGQRNCAQRLLQRLGCTAVIRLHADVWRKVWAKLDDGRCGHTVHVVQGQDSPDQEGGGRLARRRAAAGSGTGSARQAPCE